VAGLPIFQSAQRGAQAPEIPQQHQTRKRTAGFLVRESSRMTGYLEIETMFQNENKINCIDSLIFEFNRTGGWRDKMAIRHPSDPRNLRAAQRLKQLAIQAGQLDDEDWKLLQPFYGWASEPFREAVSTAARGVGFQKK
jgi:hypothetical protein